MRRAMNLHVFDPPVMANGTGSWWRFTFNPWIGCAKISEACKNCYAERDDALHRWGSRTNWGRLGPRYFHQDNHWERPGGWQRAAVRDGKRYAVFCASEADVFERHEIREISDRQDEARARLWNLIEHTPNLTWMLVTKRPENIARMLPSAWLARPRPNVWLLTTVELQQYVKPRIEALLSVPAVVHGLSCEPLLGDLDVLRYLGPNKINWVIAGDEDAAKNKRRTTEVGSLRRLRDQCQLAGVAYHIKQWCGPDTEGITGARTGRKLHLPKLDGRVWDQFPR